MQMSFSDGIFICRCSHEERSIPRKAGFRFDMEERIWYTDQPREAARLREYADSSAKRQIDRLMITCSPWRGPLPFPKKLTPYDFQIEAAKFALSRNRSYLALEAGLGKTIVAALVANALRCPTVVICPPFLARNIEAEFHKWCTGNPQIVRVDTREAPLWIPDILIVPDTLIHRESARAEMENVYLSARRLGKDALLIVDEAHRFKTVTAVRTRAILGDEKTVGLMRMFKRQVYLSGTPMPNRPIELYPVLSKVAPETISFMTRDQYGMKFCAGFYNGHGYDFSGASNMETLKKRVRGKFMLRLRKKQVLKELPPKTEEIVIIGDLPPKFIAMEAKLLKLHSPVDLMAGKVSSEHVATYRKELGELKVKPAVEFIRSLLEESDESFLVLAFHKKVISDLVFKLKKYKPFVITGGTKDSERHESVKTFQKDPTRRLFIGNYLAMGLGLTLTKASQVIFVEPSWSDSQNDQGSDRVHRIGQLENVHVRFLVYQDSIDRKVMETILRTREVTSYI